MRPDDDDDAENGSGPPPDPSLRQWRHPSEIAAASAAAARQEEPAPLRRHGPLAMALAVTAAASIAVGFGALIVAAVIDSAGSDGAFSIGQNGAAQLADPETSMLTSSLLGVATGTEGRQEPTSSTTGSGSGPTSTSDLQSTTTTVPAPTTMPASTTTLMLDDPRAEQSSPAGDGLFAAATARARRLAAFLVVDETIFTSASAIDGYDEVAVRVDGQWATAIVVARDQTNDLAILDVADPTDKARILADYPAVWSAPERSKNTPEGARIVLVVDGENPVEGFVIDGNHRVVATTGDSVYGALLTSAPKPKGSSGAALTDEAGALIGLVVDSAEHMTSVVPVDTLVAIGRSVREWGVPAVEWLGIKGSSLPNGGVRLDEVMVDGPAHMAELHAGDVITRIDGVSILDWDHLVYLVRRSGAGSTITVLIQRDAISRQVQATIGAKPEIKTILPTEAAANS